MSNLLYSYLKNIWHKSATLNNQNLASLVENGKDLKVLDLGCESGSLILKRIVSKIKDPQIFGIDIDPKAVKEAKKRGVIAIQADLEMPLPYKANFFNLVSANQIVEHLVNTDLFLKEIFRVLKPHGYLILSTENLASWHNIFALIMGWQAFSQDVSELKRVGNPLTLIRSRKPKWTQHLKIFTLRGLREAVELAGFEIEKVFGAGYYPFPPSISATLSKINPSHCAFIGLKARKKVPAV